MRNKVTTTSLLVTLLISPVFASAQTVDFNQNRDFGPGNTANRFVYSPDNMTPLVGTNFVALLYYEATEGASSLTPVAQFNRFRNVPTTDPLAGTWVGATRTLTGRAAGDNVTLQVYFWDSSIGTLDQVRAAGGWWGTSAPWDYTVPSTGANPSAFYIHGFRSFALIPEPSVVALGFLGAFAIVLLKRPHSRKPNAQ